MSLPLPAILGSPITAARSAPLQMLQREYRLPDLAPESRFITTEAVQRESRQAGEPQEALRELSRLEILVFIAWVDWL